MSIPVVIDVRDVDFATLRLDLDLVDMELTTLEEVGWLVLRQAVEQGKADDSLLDESTEWLYPPMADEEVEVLDEQDESD